MPHYHAKITGRDYDAMFDLVRKDKVNVARHTIERLAKGYRIDAHPIGMQIRALRSAGHKVDRIEDADRAGKVRQKEARKITPKSPAVEAL